MKKPLILFYPNLPKLSKNEMEVLDLLIDAGKLIVPIYLEQEKYAESQINKAELERAAKNNPAIFDPYTVVEKIEGKIVATPYHIKYAKLLKPIAKKLIEASKLTTNKEFGNALKIQAEALLNGTYDQATINWLKTKQYILDISILPLKPSDNRMPFSKASYQAWVGVVDVEGTKRFHTYKDVTLSSMRHGVLPENRIDNPEKIKGKVLDIVILSGFMARTKFAGVHLPTDVAIVEKYGSEITLFNQANDLKVKEQIIPVFDKIFSPEFKEGFSFEDLRRGYLRAVALHELAHSYLYYKNASQKLQDLFPIIDELAATALGLRLSGSLLLIDRITEKQLESMIVAYLCRSFYYTLNANTSQHPLRNYAVGGNILINFMFQHGAIKKSEKYVVLNFMKIFVCLHDLSDMLEKILSSETRKDAEKFIVKYGKLN